MEGEVWVSEDWDRGGEVEMFLCWGKGESFLYLDCLRKGQLSRVAYVLRLAFTPCWTYYEGERRGLV